MAGGFSKDGAVQEQIDASISDAVSNVRRRLPSGASAEYCDECGRDIPLARREAIPGVRYCVACQEALDEKDRAHTLYNRRGSKDSQLR
ncbi:MAG: DksA/TraR family C4-type zinc finger protein [Pseudomonadota bacterium]